MRGRGWRAYGEAYEYISDANPEKSQRWIRRTAWRYLRLTASPPLTREEKLEARALRRWLTRKR